MSELLSVREKEERQKFEKFLMQEIKGIESSLIKNIKLLTEGYVRRVASLTGCNIEVSRVVAILEQNWQMDADLVCDNLQTELVRLRQIGEEVPFIESYELQFAITEGSWIKFLYVNLPEILNEKLQNLKLLEEGIFGTVKEAEPEDAAYYMVELFILFKTIIEVVIETWVKTHIKSFPYESAIRIVGGLKNKRYAEGAFDLDEIREPLVNKFNFLRSIIDTLEKSPHIKKSSEILTSLIEELTSEKDTNDLSLKTLSCMILEVVMEK
ncbi:MAG: hypothetical protein ACFE68_03970 [Candidatus Hodarchaeota archaeon]